MVDGGWFVTACVVFKVKTPIAISSLRIFKLLKQQTVGSEEAVLVCSSRVY